MHNFYVAMGPAGILAATFSLVAFLCSYFLNHFYVLLIIHFFLLPTNTFALPPWSGIPGGGVGCEGDLVKEEGREVWERGSSRSRVWEGWAHAQSANPPLPMDL